MGIFFAHSCVYRYSFQPKWALPIRQRWVQAWEVKLRAKKSFRHLLPHIYVIISNLIWFWQLNGRRTWLTEILVSKSTSSCKREEDKRLKSEWGFGSLMLIVQRWTNLAASQGPWDSIQTSPRVYFMCDHYRFNLEEALPKLAPCGHVFGMRKATRPAKQRGRKIKRKKQNSAFSTHVFVSTFNKNPVWPPEAIP